MPIGLGYFAVSFAFGLFAANGGLSALTTTAVSLTNLTSAGQFAGVQLIFLHRSFFEIALTTLLINLRYMLMSLSLSQKVDPDMGIIKRLLISYGITDEIYAVAISQKGQLTARYLMTLMILPVAGWTLGTLSGALVGHVLPEGLQSALGIALYAMFVAIVMPPLRQSRPIALVVLAAALISTLIHFMPLLSIFRGGWQIILATLAAAALGAVIAPVQHKGETKEYHD